MENAKGPSWLTGAALDIKSADRANPLPLSYEQLRIWRLQRTKAAADLSCTISLALRLDGDLQKQVLQAVLDHIVSRHEILRTTLILGDGEPLQSVSPMSANVVSDVQDLSHLTAAEGELEIIRDISARSQQWFDVERGPLMHSRLLRLSADAHILILTLHPIIADGDSLDLLAVEIVTLYGGWSQGQPDPLPPVAIQYGDYAVRQRALLDCDRLRAHTEFWARQTLNLPARLDIPIDRPRPASGRFATACTRLTLPPPLTAALRALSKRHDVTLFMTLLAAWAALLARLTRQGDVVTGTMVNNRQASGARSLIGAFAYLLPLRIRLENEPSVTQLLAQLKATTLATLAHQTVPFDMALDAEETARTAAVAASQQVVFGLETRPPPQTVDAGALKISRIDVDDGPTGSELSLRLVDTGDAIGGTLQYAKELFEETTLVRFAESFQTLLEGMVSDDTRTVSRLPLLNAAQRQHLLTGFNAPAATQAHPYRRLMHSGFETQAAAHPDMVALICVDQQLSYGELNQRANRLAHHLIDLGVRPDDRVALCIERSIDMVVGLLGILKAGGAYVPLDPAYPAERLAFMLSDSSPKAIVTQATLVGSLQAGSGALVVLDGLDTFAIGAQPHNDPDPAVLGLHAGHLAYVIYTSGSTGTPKGVLIEHANVSRLFSATENLFRFDRSDVWTLFHSFAFDFSVWEIWGALLYGGRLVVVPYLTSRNPAAFYRLLCEQRVTILNQTPSAFRQLIAAQAETDSTHCLRQVIFGGEALELASLRPWYRDRRNRETRLANMYGITETTVHVTYRALQPADAECGNGNPIGLPIPDLQAYILDENGEPSPIGVVGELFIGGPGLARGYLGRPELTAQRFVPDPFANTAGARLYKTGDLARRLESGEIDYVGRNDNQVKIRGFRIELGEIEAQLVACPGVREAVVVAREDSSGELRLVAYLTASDTAGPSAAALRARLSATLAQFMVPSAFVTMSALPLTANGKLDRQALPAPVRARPEQAHPYSSPVGPTETLLCALFAEQTETECVGRLDNFFDLGGSSLSALRVLARLQGESGATVAPADFFNQPTPGAIAVLIDGRKQLRTTARSLPGAVPHRGDPAGRRDERAVAIIGMAGRFPGAGDIDTLWRNLEAGIDGITRFTDADLDPSIDQALRTDPAYVKARNIIDDADCFDADFFGIRPAEAVLIDPQQRIFLELAWHCLESAGYVPDACPTPVGVFGGMYNASYFEHNVRPNPEAMARVGPMPLMLGTEKDYFATRVAHRLNLTGPAVSIHTACSTSLVAIAQAVTSLRAGQCGMALAGGVSITSPVRSGYLYQEGSMLSPDGTTRTFDAEARGTVFGDGAGVVLLKRLTDACADGDIIHGVIQGVAINNDGGDKASFTAPSVDGQAAVVVAALADAGVAAHQISYVEAHGTATPIGDPIEIAALTKAYRTESEAVGFCRIGSIKSNIGHLVTAAGVAGLIKTTLALKHEMVPATLHYTAPNPVIDFASSPFVVNKSNHPWPRGTTPRLAGVSSFGVGGTNAHVIVGEAPHRQVPEHDPGPQLLVVSARTSEALRENLQRLAAHLATTPELALADVAYTLSVGRKPMMHRASVVASDLIEASGALATAGAGVRQNAAVRQAVPDVAFMFPGQGAQYAGMGSALYAREPVFRAAVDEVCACVNPLLTVDLRDRLFAADAEALAPTAFTQPALFCIEYALARYWLHLGLAPAALIGHSIGEFVAATLAGVFTLAEAARLVTQRGRLMQALPPGAMLGVRMPAATLLTRLPETLCLAAENAPQMSVVAGPQEAIIAFAAALEQEGIGARGLATSHAFHSAMMADAVAPFRTLVASCNLQPPRLPIYSTVTGAVLSSAQACDPDYWANQLRAPVRFAPALEKLLADRHPVLLECGPRQTLSVLARQQASDPGTLAIASLSDAAQAESKQLLTAVGKLWNTGAQVALTRITQGNRPLRVMLPGYAFARQRHWLDAPAAAASGGMQAVASPSGPSSAAKPAALALIAKPRSLHETTMPDTLDRTSRPALIEQLRTLLDEITGVDMSDVSPGTPFLELGLDSLALTQVALQLKKALSIQLTFRQLMGECASLELLAAHVATQNQMHSIAPCVASPAAQARVVETHSAPLSAPVTNPGPLAGAVNQSAATACPGPFIEQVIERQMQLMSQHLALIQSAGALGQKTETAVSPVETTRQDALSAAAGADSIAATPVVLASSSPITSAPDGENDPSAARGAMAYDVKKAFGAIARIHKDNTIALTDRQQLRLATFIRRYTSRTQGSKRYTAQHRAHLADPRVVNGFRPATKEIVYQIVVGRSAGAKLWDVDGNEYIDVINGFGMSLFGWQPEFVTKAVTQQITEGYEIGPLHPLAGEVAKLVCEMTGHDRAGFCNTGSEAVMGAMRIARTVTGRNLIVLFTGSYHGIFDEVIVRGTKRLRPVPAAPGILPNTTENVVVMDYGTPETLAFLRERADDIAAVLIEPVQSRRPDFQPVEFLREVRSITRERGVVFILDEVITGFRCAQGGVQELFGIQADLCTYGKTLGGGFPIGVIAGKRAFMDALDGGAWQYGDDSVPTVGVTYFAGTFCRHPLALAAAKATLTHLKENGPALQEELTRRTREMAEELNAFCKSVGAPVEIRYFASLWKTFFTEEHPLQDLLFAMMRDRGIHVIDNFPCFMTTAHDDAAISVIKSAFIGAVEEMQQSEFLPRRVEASLVAQSRFDAATPPLPDARLGKDRDGKAAWFVPDAHNPGKYCRLER